MAGDGVEGRVSYILANTAAFGAALGGTEPWRSATAGREPLMVVDRQPSRCGRTARTGGRCRSWPEIQRPCNLHLGKRTAVPFPFNASTKLNSSKSLSLLNIFVDAALLWFTLGAPPSAPEVHGGRARAGGATNPRLPGGHPSMRRLPGGVGLTVLCECQLKRPSGGPRESAKSGSKIIRRGNWRAGDSDDHRAGRADRIGDTAGGRFK